MIQATSFHGTATTVIGQTISQLRILEKLGGGMGVVYKGRIPSPRRFLALKILPDELCGDRPALEGSAAKLAATRETGPANAQARRMR
jgi:hypothetical protein